ncbi:hypothetical protein Tco_1375525 [Tanacetum coccineum]
MENANPPSTFEPPLQHLLATDIEQMLNSMRHQVNPLFHVATSMTGRNRDFWQTLPEPSRQRQFEGIILSFMRDQEEELRQLEEYMNEIDDEFMHLSLMVIEMIEKSPIIRNWNITRDSAQARLDSEPTWFNVDISKINVANTNSGFMCQGTESVFRFSSYTTVKRSFLNRYAESVVND